MIPLTENATSVLQAVITLAAWTMVMWLWMLGTRIRAMNKAKLDPQVAARTNDLPLPQKVLQVSDNYNHLFEAPTVFYAVAIAVVLMNLADQLHVILAWGYVILRVVHSVVQATINLVMIRFLVFTGSWLLLAAMIVRAILASF